MRTTLSTFLLTPKTSAMQALEENLDGIVHMLRVNSHAFSGLGAQVARLHTLIDSDFDLPKKGIAATSKQLQSRRALAKLVRSLKRIGKTFDTRIEQFQTINRWQVVMLVTCVEAYLQDVLTTAASVDPKLMSKSEQHAPYADVISATSLEALANELRARWARGWLRDGGPTRWIARLGKMGARGYSKDLGSRLELIWGIRHVVVHTAGVATADFVKRHPGAAKAAGDRVRVNHHDYGKFVEAVREFLDPTEGFFLARYPSMLAVSTAPAK